MTSSSSSSEKKGGRLTLVATPFHYDLSYHDIDFVGFTFRGVVAIHLNPLNSLSSNNKGFSLTLNTLDLSLVKANLEKRSRVTQTVLASTQAESFHYDLKDQACTIVFIPTSQLNSWDVSNDEECIFVLTIEFQGFLNDQMCGLYRSFYTGLDGNRRVMATTQFEATDARRAFPCLDEPALKATFQLSLRNIPARYQCLSNTPIASRHTTYHAAEKIELQAVTFQKTPKMSTYLVALIVGEFDFISESSNQVVTTAYTVPGKADQAQFALDTAVRCLDLFQQLFHIPYPLTKNDLVAIPDFAAGAMENWGLITYREAKVLVAPGQTSETSKRGIARTICHELAHQWFGNLVTMEFWTQLWLKEGVARFSEFLAIDALFPEWNAWSEFAQSVCGLALSLDSMKSSHPVEVEVVHPDEISEIFDAISYAKGASIIRMIYAYIGRETFLNGMRLYLTRFANGNAVTNDFWQALDDATPGNENLVEFMAPWTQQMGYPILCLDDSGDWSVHRFLASGREDGLFSQWPIPITALVQGMDAIQGPWTIQGVPSSKDDSEILRSKIREWSEAGLWFKLNVNQTGFYRVSYSPQQWKRLESAMAADGPLSVTDRLGLISDSFSAGKAGFSSLASSLALVKDFGTHETADYVVWQELAENLESLATLFRSEDFFPKYRSFLRAIFSKQLSVLGWEAKDPDESPRAGTLRATAIRMLCIAGDTDVQRKAFEKFRDFENDPQTAGISGDIQEVVFAGALRYNEEYVHKSLRSIFENRSTFPEEQRNILSVLGSVKDPKLHEEYLNYVLFSGRVRLQDVAFPLSSLANSSDKNGRATWNFFCKNFERLHRQLGSGPMWAACVGLSCRGLTTLKEADEVEAYFVSKPHGSATRRLQQVLEIVRTNAHRRDRVRDSIGSFLEGLSP